MTASFSASSALPLPPTCKQGFFSLKERRGKAEEIPKTAHNEWEKEAAHINLKPSQLGGHREVRRPPGRMLSRPEREAGEYLLDGPGLVSINCSAESVRCVCGLTELYTISLSNSKDTDGFRLKTARGKFFLRDL